MNKTLLFSLFLVLFSIHAYGQYSISYFTNQESQTNNKLDLGVMFSGGVSSIHEAESGKGDWGPDFSYGGGMFARYALIKNVAFQTELLYNSHKAYNYREIEVPTQWGGYYTEHADVIINSSSLQIPVSVLISPNHMSSSVSVYAGAGFYGAIPLTGKYSYDYESMGQTYSVNLDIKDEYPSLLYGYNLMLGVKAIGALAELRYSYDLNGLGYDKDNFIKMNNWSLRFNLGYAFF